MKRWLTERATRDFIEGLLIGMLLITAALIVLSILPPR